MPAQALCLSGGRNPRLIALDLASQASFRETRNVQVRLLLGPAGSGKTYRCLAEARQALAAAADGPPLLLIAPKQTTYQLEHQLLADGSIPGYTRLQILSLERLAYYVFDRLGRTAPDMLDEEGRLMVLRGLLTRKRQDLKLFRASARLTGFARQLSLVLSELQRHQLTPEALNRLAEQARDVEGLAYKLQDLATLLQDYLEWLKARGLKDVDCLLGAAADALRERAPLSEANLPCAPGHRAGWIEEIWVDGFAEWAPQELDFLAALLPCCGRATITFCLDQEPAGAISWLSSWSVIRRSCEEARQKFATLPDTLVAIEVLSRSPNQGRFRDNPILRHLEQYWAEPQPYASPADASAAEAADALRRTIRVAVCADPEAEVALAAREILRHARGGGRYREVTVLARKLAGYHEPLQRIFSRYQIPFFLDRRESVSHHPLAELTRSALRTVAYGWQHDDWFAVLKTGLAGADDKRIDALENEALARGWRGALWRQPLRINDPPRSGEEASRLRELERELESLRLELVPPFEKLARALGEAGNRSTGPRLAAALRELWATLKVQDQLESWSDADTSAPDFRLPHSVHATVWEQANGWLANLELAFPEESLSLREWLPILDAGLANLTVGVIPPALDQVLIGAIDRSRNPEIKLAIVLGLNEAVFPAPPQGSALLTETDRLELEKQNVRLGATARQQLGRERFHAYIACTRARERIVLTRALRDADGAPLNPSPFLNHLRLLFPALEFETAPATADWRQSEHLNELVAPLLKARWQLAFGPPAPTDAGSQPRDPLRARELSPEAINPSAALLAALPGLASLRDRLRHFQSPDLKESLDPALASLLYGPVLRTSVSRMEQFAACPFKFFVHSGLRAEERKRFELDVREQGSFQHDCLALFHQQLRQANQQWRDLTPPQARTRIEQVARALVATYHGGLLEATEQSRFLARVMIESLQDFVETLVGWMRAQYRFDPVEVELPFGQEGDSPAWVVRVDDARSLALQGRIDRVDLRLNPDGKSGLCVVLDYKSSEKKLDPVLLANGLQLQLPTYLNVMRRWPDPRSRFGVDQLVPAGVFYVSLRGKYERGRNRRDALADAAQARKLAYRHSGRFDARILRQLDARPDASDGDQFNYHLTKSGEPRKGSAEALDPADFLELLDAVETMLRRMGERVFAGDAEVAPYRKGKETACRQCDYLSVCRMDPWTHAFRVLNRDPVGGRGAPVMA